METNKLEQVVMFWQMNKTLVELELTVRTVLEINRSKYFWWSRLKKLHKGLNSGNPVAYWGCLGDRYTSLDTQKLFFKFSFFNYFNKNALK